MNKEMRKKFKVSVDWKKELSKPKPMSVFIVTDNSKSKDFDEAKVEWELESAIDETGEGFTNVCGLCHNPHLKCNFVLHNPNTGKRLHVGSTCIIRFGLVSGNVDFETGVLLINNFVDEQYHLFEIRSHLKSVMVLQPDAKDFKIFCESLRNLLDIKGIKHPTLDQLGEVCFGESWFEVKGDNFKPRWLQTIWEKPWTIETTKPTKVSKLPVFKEHSTWGQKKRQGAVYGAMAGRSNLYKVDKFVENKDLGKEE